MAAVRINDEITVGDGLSPAVIAGPCVIESERLCLQTAGVLQEVCGRLGLPFVFKASFDKANRTSIDSFRGPGMEKGLEALMSVKERLGAAVTTDIHLPAQAVRAAQVVDILQIPAFLCRQTDLIAAAAETGLPLNVKKGQFMAPHDMKAVIEKAERCGNKRVLLCERGTFFGYNDLIADMRSIPGMRALGRPVLFDATHSIQKPGAMDGVSGGEPGLAATLALAAVAAGADGVFIETHPDPRDAASDAACMMPLQDVEPLLKRLKSVFSAARA